MKKRLLTLCTVILSTAALVGCRGFEKDVTVHYFVPVYDSDLNITGYEEQEQTDVTNIFQNVVLPTAGKVSGESFLGWYVDKDFSYETGNTELLYKGAGLLHYNEISTYAKDGNLNLYAIYGQKEFEHHDLAIAYYAKSSTSGCTDEVMAKFETELRAYIATLSDSTYDFSSLDLVIKGYSGDVGTSCGLIVDDYDKGTLLPNLMIGWKGNLTFTDDGDVHYTNAVTGVTIGAKTDRRIHKMSYSGVKFDAKTTYLTDKVIEWLGTDEGKASLAG